MKWEKVKLGKILETLTDYHANGSYEKLKENVELLDKSNYAVMIRTKNLESNDFQQDLKYITEAAYNYLKKSKVFPNDILMNKIANAGSVYLMPKIEKPVSLAMNLFLIRCMPNKASQTFIFYQLKYKENYIKRFTNGTATKTITKEAVRNLNVFLPSVEEQEKIASFLDSVALRITQLRRKHEFLETYKKGVIQKIFSQEIRFKQDDGKPFPDWEKKKLGSVAKFFSGGTPTSTKPNYYNGKIPFIKSGEINSESTSQFLSEEGFKNSSAKKVEIGDLLYALYGATSGESGISKIRGAINQAVLCIRSEKHNKIFLLNFLQSQKTLIIAKYLQGGQGNLSADIVKSLRIPTPNLEEQEKIANFLASIDKKIEAVGLQIEKLEEFKKGLLQKMFV